MAVIKITPLTYAEFGQVRDHLEAKKSLWKLKKKLSEKTETFSHILPLRTDLPKKPGKVWPHDDFSLDDEWQKTGIRISAANGYTQFLSHIESEVTEFELPDDLKEHIAKGKPVMMTKWW